MSRERIDLIRDWEPSFQQEQAEISSSRVAQLNENYYVVGFVSQSAGRGKRRRPREITLLSDRNTGKTKMITETPRNGLDVIAQEIFEGTIGPEEDAFQLLLATIQRSLASKYGQD